MDILVYSGPSQSGEIVRSLLGARFDIRIVDATPGSLLPEFERCTVFLDASMKVPVTAESIARAKDLKLVITATTGANHIDQAALDARGIPLLTLKGQKGILNDLTGAAEQSWLLLMACARRLRGAIHHVEAAGWERTEFPGVMLKDKVIGIIGMGRIGSWMSRYAHAFRMSVQGYDPFAPNFPEYVKPVALDELLASSDFVTIHVNLTPETVGMLNAEKVRKLKVGCIFINTSRGELVDESALVEGLRGKRIAAVGVDVLGGEPEIAGNPLWQYAQDHQNVVITPHVGGFCPESVNKVVEFSCKRILNFFGEL